MSSKKRGSQPSGRSKPRNKKTAKNRVKLKPRQAMLLEGLVEGKSVRAAALDAGYSPNTAQHPSDLLDTIAMREAMSRLLASPEKIAQRINEGLDAVETKFFQFEGIVTDHRDVVAWSERRMYADLAAELKGMKRSQKVEGGNTTNVVRVSFVNVALCAEP